MIAVFMFVTVRSYCQNCPPWNPAALSRLARESADIFCNDELKLQPCRILKEVMQLLNRLMIHRIPELQICK
jgi:hypothetical protein